MNSVQEIIAHLDLKPHPEGGYFRETYRSDGVISSKELGDKFEGDRNYSTCIYFLLTSGNYSAFHRIKQDEIWHFYRGSAIRLHIISPEGKYTTHSIGANLHSGQRPQLMVAAGYWFAAEVAERNSYSLVGCTVSPGFSFKDFEMGDRTTLIKKYPEHTEIISALTK